jgi:hypothetical protein
MRGSKVVPLPANFADDSRSSKQHAAIEHGSLADLRSMSPAPGVEGALAACGKIFSQRSDLCGRMREYDHVFQDGFSGSSDADGHLARKALCDALTCANAVSMRQCAALVDSGLCLKPQADELRAMVWATQVLSERLRRGEFLREPLRSASDSASSDHGLSKSPPAMVSRRLPPPSDCRSEQVAEEARYLAGVQRRG